MLDQDVVDPGKVHRRGGESEVRVQPIEGRVARRLEPPAVHRLGAGRGRARRGDHLGRLSRGLVSVPSSAAGRDDRQAGGAGPRSPNQPPAGDALPLNSCPVAIRHHGRSLLAVTYLVAGTAVPVRRCPYG